jgi:guanosine-3',5'-bis(diphosphate) 3'-pyrophosphohydrolase
MTKALKNAGMTEFEVSGRPKHLWSVYRKMVDKGLAFEDIHDLIAFRVVVDNIGQCYEALGHIHAIWRPIPGRFKDYIAMPKPNGYRSLHTTLIGRRGERVEIQIRTYEMHEVAEEGIAAHWKYKENGSVPLAVKEAADRGFVWLRQLMDWQRELKDPNEFLDSVKVDLFAEEVYIFTPRGDVIELPRGATPVDFAFAIHSNVGLRCSGAKVNNRIVPLRHVLESGDTCEILTQKEHLPKKAWLEFVKTSRARTKIRSTLRQLERDRSREIGTELLEKEFRRYGTSSGKWLKDKEGGIDLRDHHYKTVEDILVGVGYGKLDARSVVEQLIPAEMLGEPKEEAKRSKLGQLIDRLARRTSSGIKLEGVDDVLVHFAKCCGPVKGDSVIGFVTRGRGLTIHRASCPKIMELDEERRVDVFWDTAATLIRPIVIRIVSDDREGMLADISMAFSRMNINISEANCKTSGDGLAVNSFKCGVNGLEQLKRVVKTLEGIKGVHSVTRAKSHD